MPIVCKKPKCVLSKDKTKCIKPNPYVQFISHCGKSGKTSDECKEEYNKKSTEIKKKACDYYESNKKVGNIKSCPKARRPVNNKCPDDFPVMKTNKHNVKCCYKATTKATTKTTTKKLPVKKVKKVTPPISSDDIPIIELKRKRKVVTPPFESAESSKKERTSTPFESAESSKKGKRTSTSFESLESSKKGKRTSTPFESLESSKKEGIMTPFESAESSKKGKRTSTPFESAESVKSSEKKEDVNRFKMGNKIYKLAKVQKYKGRKIPVKVIRHKFPQHKIDEVLRELEKPRKMASITQSSPMKEKRKATSRKIISAPSKIKYLKDQEQGWFDWIRGKRNKPPSKIIDNELNKKIKKIYQQESDKRHKEMYPDKYAKNLTRKEIELLQQANARKGKKNAISMSLSKKAAKERRLSDPNLKFKKPQKKGIFDWFKAREPAPMIDNELNKRVEMLNRQESDKRHREMYPEKYAKNLTRKEIELLQQANARKGKKNAISMSLSKKAAKERRLSDPNLKFKKPQKKGIFDWFKAREPAPMIDNELNKRVEMLNRQESDKRHREMYPEKYAKNLTRKEIELLIQADIKNQGKGVKPISDSFSFGNKAKNRYEGHMSAPESISLNKGQLKVSVPSLDPKAKKYFDDKLMKKIEEIKAKVPPKKQKGWFQKLFGNESSSNSEENKKKKKWYEY